MGGTPTGTLDPTCWGDPTPCPSSETMRNWNFMTFSEIPVSGHFGNDALFLNRCSNGTCRSLGKRATLGSSSTAGPKDLQSDFSAMRLYQAVVQARSLLHSGKASSLSDGVTRPTTGFNLDALCDRVALEKDWVNQTGQPKPRLDLKKQFRYCAKGEIGYFAPKHIISALPEEGERPTKSHRKLTVDGFEKEEEEEERANPQTRRQLERMHMVFRNNLLMCTLAFPQFQQFDITKSDLDEWYDWFYGPSIAGRRPPPSEFTLLWSERNAWRQIYQLMADGSTLKTAMKTIKEDQLFWTREVYERVLFQQLKTPRDPKGKGKGKDKGKKGGKTKGVYQDHLKNKPGKGNGKNDKSSKGGRPNGWPQNWALQAPNKVQYCRDFHLKHSCPGNCGRSHACPVRVNGHAMETTLLTSVQTRGKLEPSWTPSS